jgi:hypothetical protein
MALFCACQLSFPNMGGVTVSSGTLSADALGYSFRAKGSESLLLNWRHYSMNISSSQCPVSEIWVVGQFGHKVRGCL